ncbi:hypothetical protein IEQ34_020678 [Dendrobium chrysotoxum]|uniref:Uncharacterized protein n=1 Tax=Dendrobium chrysotoxum TaxID=161865 RepID=A0AAV7G0U4_DENCH|nr:hypothetical protein IEQ34_020678 [Dendrobium chrysotoxum]
MKKSLLEEGKHLEEKYCVPLVRDSTEAVGRSDGLSAAGIGRSEQKAKSAGSAGEGRSVDQLAVGYEEIVDGLIGTSRLGCRFRGAAGCATSEEEVVPAASREGSGVGFNGWSSRVKVLGVGKSGVGNQAVAVRCWQSSN